MPLPLLQGSLVTHIISHYFALFVGSANGDAHWPLHHALNLGPPMVVLPRQQLMQGNQQDFRGQLTRNHKLVYRQPIKILVGKLLRLAFVDDEKTAPGAGGILPLDAEAGGL
ncbi:hypothetical protein [Hymenobacter nivis]|uniref:hypothetical protein n=1 Tax=Hymenobacter nivis TaxID=1850093 RepID=UPI0013A5BA6A